MKEFLKRKRIITLLLVTVCILVLASCGASEDYETEEYQGTIKEIIPETCENTGVKDWYALGLEYCVKQVVMEMAPNYQTDGYRWESNWEEDKFLTEDGCITQSVEKISMYVANKERPYIRIIFGNGAELMGEIDYIFSVERSAAEYDEFTGELLNPIGYNDLVIKFNPEWSRISVDGTVENYKATHNNELFLRNDEYHFSCDIEGDRHVRDDNDNLVCGCGK